MEKDALKSFLFFTCNEKWSHAAFSFWVFYILKSSTLSIWVTNWHSDSVSNPDFASFYLVQHWIMEVYLESVSSIKHLFSIVFVL